MLKLNVDFNHSVDWSGMRKTPAGVRGWGDPAGAKRRGGSPARPRKAKRLERKSTDMLSKVFRRPENDKTVVIFLFRLPIW
ncbi:hypothetical protein [Neobacillus drentensis]|uniref:hypothetical protein n=1 Tax=Neobacillus drentensis TaxID=220684 RepID=UPI002FFDBC99